MLAAAYLARSAVARMNKPKLRLVTQSPEQRIEALRPGELLVQIVREGRTIPPDHKAIAKANRALRNWTVYVDSDRDAKPSV